MAPRKPGSGVQWSWGSGDSDSSEVGAPAQGPLHTAALLSLFVQALPQEEDFMASGLGAPGT